MWFKNLQTYRLPRNWQMTADLLATLLEPQRSVPIGSNELQRQGWGGEQLVRTVDRQMLLRLDTERKLVPASVINREARRRAAEMPFPPGKKAMKELRERIADELLPRAFPQLTSTHVWIDPVNGWLVVDSATPARADDAVKLLLKAVDRMPLESLRVQRSPVAVMTAWLETDEAPAGFTVDQDAIMQARGESKASVRYVKHTLEVDDVRRHIAAGKQCTRLALTWSDKISFVLDESLTVRSVRPLDILTTHGADDNELTLMTGEFAALLRDLVEALGGEATA